MTITIDVAKDCIHAYKHPIKYKDQKGIEEKQSEV